MKKKEVLVPLYLKDGKAVCGRRSDRPVADGDAVRLASHYGNTGADGILFFDLSKTDEQHEEAIRILRGITQEVDIPVYGGGHIRRTEDVKKLLYAGCRAVFLNYSKYDNRELTEEVSDRFGKDKILASLSAKDCQDDWSGEADTGTLLPEKLRNKLGGVLILADDPDTAYPDFLLEGARNPLEFGEKGARLLPVCLCVDGWTAGRTAREMKKEPVCSVADQALMEMDSDCMKWKHALRDEGADVNVFSSSLTWDEVKTGPDGLLPVVVQDDRTQEVLMVAYMNREAFETTIKSGRMTYWSRSRQELWVKGLTSGHFQYVRELRIDCDNDTLLALVHQIGAACHTGNRSCFYRTILQKERDARNPMKVFEDVMQVILDRKEHPKQGSYTNYLFDKGIDKILKKVGEEAKEIVIAAKNPDAEEIKYEISDFLYHVMVLMAEKGVSWEDITRELAQR